MRIRMQLLKIKVLRIIAKIFKVSIVTGTQNESNKMIELGEERHIILYAKNWYKHKDLTEDLKILCGNISGIDPEHIDMKSIWHWVFYTWEKIISPERQRTFLRDRLFRFPYIDIFRKKDSLKAIDVIEALMSEIGLSVVMDDNHNRIFKTGHTDPELLEPKYSGPDRLEKEKLLD
jgi:hypothetical protein